MTRSADTQPRVSCVIPSWNRKSDLRVCLQSLRRQQGVQYEAIVVDDASHDGSPQMVREEFPEATLICGHFSVGPAHRRNQGVVASSGEYVLQLDSDSEFTNPRALTNMATILATRPEVGSVGGEIAAHVQDWDHVHGVRLDKRDSPQRVTGGREEEVQCDFLATLCCMMRRADAITLGGYDPYLEYGGEDTDLGYRLKKAGFQNIARYDCAAVHHASPSGRHADASYRFCMAGWRFTLKHRGVPVFLFRFGWYAMRLAATLLIRPFCGGGGNMAPERIAALRAIVRAALPNARGMHRALYSRSRDFLDFEEMRRFERWKARRQAGATHVRPPTGPSGAGRLHRGSNHASS